ncbi:MAG: hypothetical protein WBD31_23700 [Rubripirellula sp.]
MRTPVTVGDRYWSTALGAPIGRNRVWGVSKFWDDAPSAMKTVANGIAKKAAARLVVSVRFIVHPLISISTTNGG